MYNVGCISIGCGVLCGPDFPYKQVADNSITTLLSIS